MTSRGCSGTALQLIAVEEMVMNKGDALITKADLTVPFILYVHVSLLKIIQRGPWFPRARIPVSKRTFNLKIENTREHARARAHTHTHIGLSS